MHQEHPASAVMAIALNINTYAGRGVMDISLNYFFSNRFLERSGVIG
ncbi:MAG: hypothetical protein J7497_06805 [Chitinophagaceae bacterium]|nr:hypothetical protein [Chitinophagaceae bacterium]